MATSGYYRPRPLSEHGALDRLILALEVPDCDCLIRVEWVRVRLGVALSPGGKPVPVFVRLPRFGWQARRTGRGKRPPPVFGAPCPHAARANHNLSYDQWRRFLALAAQARGDEDGYADPPLDPCPWQPDSLSAAAESLYRDGRVGLLAERAALGLALFHPGDWHRGNVEGVGIAAGTGRAQGGLVYEQGQDGEDEAEEALEALADLWAMAKAGKPGRAP